MAADPQVAQRYARALMELAEESGAIEKIATDLRQLVALALSHDGVLLATLSNPVFTLEERRGVLDTMLGRMGLHPMTANIARLLLDKSRFAALPDIADTFSREADARAGRVRVKVQTAEPLTGPLEAEVRTALERVTGKSVVLETEVAAGLIGGMVARVGGTVYDASIRTRLENIKSRLLATQQAAQA